MKARFAPTANLGTVLIREEVLALAKKRNTIWDIRLAGGRRDNTAKEEEKKIGKYRHKRKDASFHESKFARATEASCHLIVDDADVAAGVPAFESSPAWFLRASYTPVLDEGLDLVRRVILNLFSPVGLSWVDGGAELG